MRAITEADLVRMNIGRRYWTASVDDIPPEAQHRKLVDTYCTAIKARRRAGQGLLLWGDNSRGKTYSACCILKVAVANGFSAYTILADDLKKAVIEETPFEDTTVINRCRAVDFLLIEDLGKEYSGATGFVLLAIEALMRHRTRELLPTIITTNLAVPEFGERYGKSVLEIAKESLYPFQVKGDGKSVRTRLALEMEGEVKP